MLNTAFVLKQLCVSLPMPIQIDPTFRAYAGALPISDQRGWTPSPTTKFAPNCFWASQTRRDVAAVSIRSLWIGEMQTHFFGAIKGFLVYSVSCRDKGLGLRQTHDFGAIKDSWFRVWSSRCQEHEVLRIVTLKQSHTSDLVPFSTALIARKMNCSALLPWCN